MIPKKSLDSVLDQSIILTKTAPNDNAKSISVQCAPPASFRVKDMGGSSLKPEKSGDVLYVRPPSFLRALWNESLIHVVFIENCYVSDKTSWIQLFTNFVITIYSALLNGIDDVLEKTSWIQNWLNSYTENSK